VSKNYRHILLILFTTSVLFSDAQTIKKFTPDSVKFLDEMTLFLENVRKKEGKDFIDDFTAAWYGGKFSERKRQGIYKTCNFMLKKKMRAFPDFKSYLFAQMSFVKSDQSEDSFDAWQESIEKLISSGKKKKFSDYLEFCNHLFTENAVYKSASTTWQSSNSNYQFSFDKEPKVTFPSLDLRCYAKKDSAVIYSTNGTYYPNQKKWIGKGGKVNWMRAGFPEYEVYAILKGYSIACKSATYTADSVVFHNSLYFDKPLLGKLTEKVLANVTPEKATYPRFSSYNKRLRIDDIVKNVDYDGGFSQHGYKFIGSGSEDEDARLIFKREDKPFLIASSKSFVIRTEKITSGTASIVIYLEHETKDGVVVDSISHPGLNFKFLKDQRLLELVRTAEGVGQSPYFNTYHNIDMIFESLVWVIDDPKMDMKPMPGSTDKSAVFESSFLFKEYDFDKLQGMDDVHPLVRLKDCSKKMGQDELYIKEVCQCLRLSETQVSPMLLRFANKGFLYYDFDNNRIQIKEKLYHYISAKSEKEDYDVLRFSSDVQQGSNASLNLLNFDLNIDGVKKIFLSDSQNVVIFPKGRKIELKENRDFKFTGVVNAGRFQFFSKESDFEYDNFKINMPTVDSMRIWVVSNKLDQYGKKKMVMVKTVVESIKSELFIDGPGNKSGLKDLAEYPILKSLKDSYVFYDRKSIQKGVYARDKFFFQLEPFVFDSLNDFKNEQLRFDGRFASADIFPEFNETLSLQPDYSLGFVRGTPESGYAVYGGKGQFFNDIKLSHKGLRGDGKFKYITSTTESNDFIFYPDSMNAIAQNYVIEEQMGAVEFPPVVAHDVFVHWRPYLDYMKVKKIEKPLVFYDGNSKLHGSITLQPKGLLGKGLFDFPGATLKADLIKFKFSEFDTDTADFNIKALDKVDAFALITTNVKAHVDFKERKAECRSNGGGSVMEFPQNQYIAYMDKFTWYMDDDNIEFSADEKEQVGVQDMQLEGSKFISIHPDQDSLSFYSPAALYDLKSYIIYAKEVRFINVADAMIYPDSGNVVLEKKAKMRTLKNARILANFITQYHNIYNASVNIFAKKNYIGSGDYDFVDENKRKQMIHFSNVAVDTAAQTYATGTILGDDNFTLSPNFEYKGKVSLTANNQYLTFSGHTRIAHNCVTISRNWLRFSSEVDPEDIYIPVDSVAFDENSNLLSTGVLLVTDSVHLYSTFLSKSRKASDPQVLPVKGYLFYDKSKREYQIANLEKLNEISLPGSYVSLNTNNCSLYGEGKMDFGVNLGQLKTTPVGNIHHDLVKNEIKLDLMILLDFYFTDNALDKMAKMMLEDEELDLADFDRPEYEKGLQELVGKETAGKLIADMTLYGSFKRFPSELNKSMFLTDVKMIWNPKTESYQSSGEIAIGNILKKQINKTVDGHIEIIKKRSGDILNIYLELDPENWYFFNYQRGLMQAISSDKEFNAAIIEVKPDKRKYKHQKGEAPYQFMFSNERKKRDFLRTFETIE